MNIWESYNEAREELQRNINNMLDSMREETIEKLINPTPYIEQFRTINLQEFDCIKVSAVRGRIPVDDPLFVTIGRLIQVSYSCNAQGVTTCVILCRAADNTYLFTGISRLNPVDSYNRKKGEALAFYRAVTESEAIILFTNLTEEK